MAHASSKQAPHGKQPKACGAASQKAASTKKTRYLFATRWTFTLVSIGCPVWWLVNDRPLSIKSAQTNAGKRRTKNTMRQARLILHPVPSCSEKLLQQKYIPTKRNLGPYPCFCRNQARELSIETIIGHSNLSGTHATHNTYLFPEPSFYVRISDEMDWIEHPHTRAS